MYVCIEMKIILGDKLKKPNLFSIKSDADLKIPALVSLTNIQIILICILFLPLDP